MGFGGSATFSSSSTSSNSTGKENTNSSTRRLTDEQYAELSNTLRKMQAGAENEDEQYSKSAAIKDTKGLVDSIFTEYRNKDLPQILEKQGASGAYSSTGTQLLANDAFASATNKAAGTVLGAIQSYAETQNAKRQTSITGLGSVLSGLLQAREDNTVDSMFSTSSNSKTKSRTAKVSASI